MVVVKNVCSGVRLLSLTDSVTIDKLLNLSKPQFPYL